MQVVNKKYDPDGRSFSLMLFNFPHPTPINNIQ